jgi:hypothetical protein
MGIYFADQYSLLHFAVGVIAYFWGIKLKYWILMHVSFEIIENSQMGMNFINKNLKDYWPGKKEFPDTFINSMLGDNFFAILGWLIAYFLDYIGTKYNWYPSHIAKG